MKKVNPAMFLPIGIAVDAGIGVALGNVAIGIGIGVATGMVMMGVSTNRSI
jgi:F0F1-type ATP synthase membrane subunit c/vacuolar-type H+-ATPase subunit K